MDVFTITLSIADTELSVLSLVTLGLCVGTLSGFFGVGGGWIVTPALNIFGVGMPFAIGTDLAYVFGQSIIATRRHVGMGNVDLRLGLLSVVGSVVGVEGGKQLVLLLEEYGQVDPIIRWVYMVLLFTLGSYILRDYVATVRLDRRTPPPPTGAPSGAEAVGPVASRLRRISFPPYVSLPASGIPRISFWVLFSVFFASGFLSGFMGVGGGFILLPALIYLVGCPTTIAVGTSLLSVLFMAGYGCFSYSLAGRTEPVAAVIMLLGAAVGAQVGALATRYVRGLGIRLLFAVMILLAGVSVALKQAEGLFGWEALSSLAGIFVLGAAGALTILIAVRLYRGIRGTGV